MRKVDHTTVQKKKPQRVEVASIFTIVSYHGDIQHVLDPVFEGTGVKIPPGVLDIIFNMLPPKKQTMIESLDELCDEEYYRTIDSGYSWESKHDYVDKERYTYWYGKQYDPNYSDRYDPDDYDPDDHDPCCLYRDPYYDGEYIS